MRAESLKLQTPDKQKEKYLSTFFIALAVAGMFFVPFMIMENGYFLFYGDFNVQQIPFYQHAHQMVRSGSWGWDFNTDLGANFIGSYSFYLLGSPFFWLTIPFPNSMVPYLMGPLLMLKFALSALTAYMYIRRFTRTPIAARLGGLLYAFSGFSVYNIFFNHFHEAIIFFPLLLLSVELLITENRRGFFAAMVAVTAISNYFFFFGMVVFTVIYWLVRTFSKCYKITVKGFLWMLFEAVLGVLMAAAILLPTYMAVIQNSRISETLVGWDAIMYGKEQIYLNIIECFFFPPDLPARPIFFPGAEVRWSSLGGWLPLFSMVGVFACMQQKKHSWTRRILGIMIFMAMVPILNSAFYMFNYAYYARWFYMPILIMSLVTASAAEDHSVSWKSPFKWVVGITAAFVAVIGLFPSGKDENGNFSLENLGLYTQDAEGDYTFLVRFLVTSAIAIISLVVLGALLTVIRQNRRKFINYATVAVCIVSVIYPIYFVANGKEHSYETSVMINDLIEKDLKLPGDKNTYRIDVYDGVDNTGLYLNYSTVNAFHSIVPGSVTEFWEFVGEERGVASRPSVSSEAARALLGVKYLLVPKLGEEKDRFCDESGDPYMESFKLFAEDSGYYIYENKNYIPFGFTYDYYITDIQCEEINSSERSNMMLKAMVLNKEQAKKYSKYMKNISTQLEDDSNMGMYSFYFDKFEMQDDAAALRENAISSFNKTENGFSATIETDRKNLVFFSIPYDEGWSATVNGKAVKIERVNAGFMAVEAPKGENKIEFTYKTPGLEPGIIISVSAICVFVIYTAVFFVLNKKGKLSKPQYPEGEALAENFKRDFRLDRLQETKDQVDEIPTGKDGFTEKLEFYASGDETDFNRGFWVNFEDDEE